MKRGELKRNTPLKAKSSIKRGSKRMAYRAVNVKHPLRDNAEGKQCTLRLDGCLPGNETVVFAHYRRFGWGGAAMKPNDLLGCFACASCHSKQERHHPDATDADLLRAMGETLMIQERDGLITT